jgi:tRNA pseudouridine13 synthase
MSPERKLSGRLKSVPEDFLVEEIPAYEPSGAGEHLYLRIEKRDVSADFLLGHLSRTLGIRREEIGMAGIKDRRAVTRQWISLPATAEPRLGQVPAEDIRILHVSRHTNKLKTGHLRGNRFEILVRFDAGGQPLDEPYATASRIAERIAAQGVPNDFGEQRFGIDGETLQLGLALLRRESAPEKIPRKRRKFLTRLALSSVQAWLFNQVLSRRREAGILHQVQPGDVMQVVASGGLFLVEEAAVEQSRFDRRETVLTGPLFGPKMKSPSGPARELEQLVLAGSGLTETDFRQYRKLTPGGRRPLLLWPGELTLSPDPHGLRFRFTLPPGAYATVVMREFLQYADETERSP